MTMFYRRRPIWIKIAKTSCVVSFVLTLASLAWFCVLMTGATDEQTEQESRMDVLIDSHQELIEKIDALIEAITQEQNR